MAVDSNSLTLTDYALMSNSPLVQYISNGMLMLGNVLQDIPLRTDPTMFMNGTRWLGDNNNADNWRTLNEESTVTKSVPTPYQEQAYIRNNAFDVDTFISMDRNQITEPFAGQLQKFMVDFTYNFNNVFINNNHITGDAQAPVGVRYRLDNPTDYGIPTEMKLSAAATDISAGSNVPKLCYYIDNMLIRMGAPEGDGVVIYCNEQFKTLLDFGLKLAGTTGGFGFVKDPFDRSVATYKNAKIRIIGRKADQTTQIITATEDTAGLDGASTYTSLYFVKYGQENAFSGWQFRSLEQSVIGPFLLPGGTQERIVFDWAVGLMQEHPRSLGRIYDIKVA
jgi:hypothetical protein